MLIDLSTLHEILLILRIIKLGIVLKGSYGDDLVFALYYTTRPRISPKLTI